MRPYPPELSDEILTEILLGLDAADLLRCLTVSKYFHSLIRTSGAIQYKLELAANGLVACSDTSWSTSSARRRLKEQQTAWLQCQWKAESQVHITQECRTYELRNGIWAYGHNESEASLPHCKAITCCVLPSATPSGDGNMQPGDRWTLKNLELDICDFTMDPLMDLLVIVERVSSGAGHPFRIHLRKLSDGQPHGLAARPVLDFDMTTSASPLFSFDVQLYGPYVGVLVRGVDNNDTDFLKIWDWRTGDSKVKMEASTCLFDDFAFVDTSHIMVLALRHTVVLEIWIFEGTPKERALLLPIYQGGFDLPLTTMESKYERIRFEGNPSWSLAGAKTIDGTPFTPGTDPHVLAISFRVINGNGGGQVREEKFAMVMRPSRMLDKLDFVGHELEWDEWGPECTRWLSQRPQDRNWEPCLLGGRYVTVGPRQHDETQTPPVMPGPQVVRMFDFRPNTISWYKDSLPDEDVCVRPSVVPKGTMFIHDVVSELSYCVSTSKELSTIVSGVMSDEGRLVCTKAEPDDSWKTLIVLTF